MSNAIAALAQVRDNLINLTEKTEAMTRQQNELLVRLTEAQTRSAEALRLARTNGDADGKHALAMKIADADVADLQALVNQGATALLEANRALMQAKNDESRAVHAARHEEQQMTATALKQAATDIEKQFLACLAEMARVQYALTGKPNDGSSLFRYWAPSRELSEAVNRFVVPPAVAA
jgi:hypothetical protein